MSGPGSDIWDKVLENILCTIKSINKFDTSCVNGDTSSTKSGPSCCQFVFLNQDVLQTGGMLFKKKLFQTNFELLVTLTLFWSVLKSNLLVTTIIPCKSNKHSTIRSWNATLARISHNLRMPPPNICPPKSVTKTVMIPPPPCFTLGMVFSGCWAAAPVYYSRGFTTMGRIFVSYSDLFYLWTILCRFMIYNPGLSSF